ncbi:hypothetical protein A7982_13504 [Minicystis rosea]|nr:hypothetical protein A7982_13504 [Minicystis rosea]
MISSVTEHCVMRMISSSARMDPQHARPDMMNSDVEERSARTIDATRTRNIAIRLATAQGLFYVVTGVWPLVSMRTFEAVTGPKTDQWLVKTAGSLIATIGATLLASAKRGRIPPEIMLLGGGSAATLATIDLVYALRGRISPIYLLDAGVEIGFAVAWTALGREREPTE